ncbi:MAG: ComF family protein [Candidatus Gastranaerophilales bacterium]|nr:ComF family protein [Candidatus Gastranaerophilales bacterium]
MINLFEKLLSLIYIQPCFFCKSTKDDNIICKKCYNKIHFLPNSAFREKYHCKVYACTMYDGIIKQLIIDLKYHNQKKLAKLFAKIMFEYFNSLNLQSDFLILPVPIHKHRKKERKYNHMDLAAEEFSRFTGFKVNKNFLKRIKDTSKQYNLHKKERLENIKNAFDLNLNENISKEQNLLIMDDITSTGTTFDEIVKVLKKNGYNNITSIALSTPDIWN